MMPEARQFAFADLGRLLVSQSRIAPARVERALLISLLVLAAVLVFATISTTSLWIDEGYTYAISQLPLPELLGVPFDTHPPYYYLLVRGALAFGENELVLRSVSAIFALAASGLLFILAKRLLGNLGALVALAVWISSYTLLTYANDARNYTLLLTLMLAMYITLESFMRRVAADPTGPYSTLRLPAILFVLSSAIAVYTHTIAILYLVILAGVMWVSVIAMNRAAFTRAALGMAAFSITIVLLTLPRLLVILATSADFDWLKQPSVIDTARTLAAVVGPNHTPVPVMLLYIAGVALGAAILLHRKDWASVAVLFFLAAYPAFIWVIGFIYKPLYMERIILPALAGGALCAGAIAAYLKPRRTAMALSAVMVISSAWSAASYLTRPADAEWIAGRVVQDWREAVQAVDEADAAIILDDSFQFPSADFYSDRASIYVRGPSGFWLMDQDDWLGVHGAPVELRASDPSAFMETVLSARGKQPASAIELAGTYRSVTAIGVALFGATPEDIINDEQGLHQTLLAAGYAHYGQPAFRGLVVRIYSRS